MNSGEKKDGVQLQHDTRRLMPASLFPLLAFALQWFFWTAIHPYVWFLFYPAIFFSSWVGGKHGGLVATALSTMLVWWFFIPERYSFVLERPASALSIGIFAGMGVLFSLTHERLRKANRQTAAALADVKAAKDHLEEQISERTTDLTSIIDALLHSEADLRKAQEIAKLGSWIYDLKNQILWSDMLYRIYGVSPETFTPNVESFINLIHPEDRPAMETWIAACSADEKPGELEFRTIWPDGTVRFISGNGELIRDAEGRPTHISGTAQDITERKQTEAALRESENRLRLFIEYAPVQLAMFDRNMCYLYLSRRWRSDYGLGDRDLFRMSHYEVFPEISEQWKEAHRRGLAGEIIQADADLFERVDGSVQWIRWEIRPWYDSAGVVGGIVIFTEDITERKRAEEELRQSEDRFRTMADAIPQLAWIAHADGFIYWYNRQWYEYTGMTPEQMEGWGWQRVHDQQMLPVVLEQWNTFIATGEPFEMVFPLRGGDGQFRKFLTRVQPLKNAQGRIVQWFGTNTDVTEIKRVEDALQKLNDELEMRVAQRTEELEESRSELEMQNEMMRETYHQLELEMAARLRAMEEIREKEQILIQQNRMAAMGEMLGNIAHQWRQPLNVLGLNIQRLGLSHELGEFNKELLDDSIKKSMDIILHLSQTIDDFMEFSMPDRLKSQFSVDKIIAKTVSLIEDGFKEQRITIETDISGAPQINGYPNEYTQVLLNILMNARDALLEQETNKAVVTVRSWSENGRAVVTITDNGGGIREEIMGQIFDPFFTTKELGKGIGVGLFMSKTIIEKNMGGRLTARNVDAGAEFRIEV